MRGHQRAVILAASLATFSCSDPTRDEDPIVGSLRMSLSGAVQGEFEAEGSLPTGNEREYTYAEASRYGQPGRYQILTIKSSETEQNIFSIDVSGVTESAADPIYTAIGTLLLGLPTNLGRPDHMYGIRQADVRISALTATRMQGSFSAIGVSTVAESFGTDTVWLSNGTFDLPIAR